MSEREARPVWFCECCAMVITSGDDSGCRYFWDHKDGTSEHPAGVCQLFTPEDQPVVGDELDHFSNAGCAGCGTTLWGERLDGVVMSR